MSSPTFLELHKQSIETTGFWSEEYRASILHSIECRYQSHVLKQWGISDIVINGDKILIKWFKRFIPLSDEDVKVK